MDIVPDKHERILAAAGRLVVRNGLQCSMAAIAEEAGVATGSLYNYFESKEALVRGLYDRVAIEMTEALVAPDTATDPAQRLQNYFSRYIDFIWENETRARLFNYLENTPLISSGDAASIFGPLVMHGRELIEAAQAAGTVRPGPSGMLMSFVRGAVRNVLKHRRHNPEPLSDEERRRISQMGWDAIRA